MIGSYSLIFIWKKKSSAYFFIFLLVRFDKELYTLFSNASHSFYKIIMCKETSYLKQTNN